MFNNTFYKVTKMDNPLILRFDRTMKFVKDVLSSPPSTSSNAEFRLQSVYPQVTDLHNDNLSIPENVIRGPYDDVDHYLQTNFTLLREDFIKPIREDLRSFLNDNNSVRLMNIKIHEIQFIRRAARNGENCFCLEIKRGVTYNSWNLGSNPKRFMTGSLVIFSNDRFKTILCGRVVDTRSLPYRKLLVMFENQRLVLLHQNYLMIECTTFFEPYYQVLKVLQKINCESFPMQDYLIRVSSSVSMPKYLNENVVRIQNSKLNESQSRAMNAALSEELLIIQGPPGTGKTFLGLKIAQQLLSMSRKWYDHSPMLVISYTNHALDQFLVGLTDTTNDMIRLGAQSQDPKMAYYSVWERRKEYYESSSVGCQQKRLIGGRYKDLKNIEQEIRFFENQIDNVTTTKPSCIFYFRVLAKGVPTIQQWFLGQEDEVIVSWLLQEDGTIPLAGDPFPNDIETMQLLYRESIKDAHKGSRYCMLSVSIMMCALQNIYDQILDIHQIIENRRKAVFKSQLDVLEFKRFFSQKKEERKELMFLLNFLTRKLEYFQLCLWTSSRSTAVPDFSKVDKNSPFTIPVNVRWQLYQHWLKKYETYMNNKMNDLIQDYGPIFQSFNAMQEHISLEVMRRQKVIGMTTTVAARMHPMLKKLKCPIVIVEEAAEVLEAHIIPALTEHCQHLILIGDHQQLKPSTADYEIETSYKLGVSLFERMVLNDIRCYTLNVQHRMRPEISSLITPSIYTVLHNHESVHAFPSIKGMRKNLFFLTHSQMESKAGESSKQNRYEAKFLIRFATYLLQNGYDPEEITVLAAYLGQVGALSEEQKSSSDEAVKKVKITSVDNFQGEENKIILLSLVRNNMSGSIGFLSIENRVCVALSRAKEGLYIMGNMALLTQKSLLWRNIEKSLKNQESIGDYLPLKCQQHGNTTLIGVPEDFNELASNGGCRFTCNIQLRCGHICTKNCHNDDLNHSEYACQEPCTKSLCKNQDHVCQKRCYEPCGNCNYPLPLSQECGHKIRCYMSDQEDYRCMEDVFVRLPCGHKQAFICMNVDNDDPVKCTKCLELDLINRNCTKGVGVETVSQGVQEITALMRSITVDIDDGDESDIEMPKKPECLNVINEDTKFEGFKSHLQPQKSEKVVVKADLINNFVTEMSSSNSSLTSLSDY